MNKKTVVLLLLSLLATLLFAESYREKSLDFENPGTRRIQQVDGKNHWFYRSLPEKSMTIKTEGVERIKLRSFGIEKLRKPQITIIIDKKRHPYNLNQLGRDEGYYLYEDIEFDLPAGTKKIEVLCYQRSIYMRAYEMVKIKPKAKQPKVTKAPNRQILSHAGMIDVSHNSTTNEYYTFNQTQPFKFKLNNSRNCVVYLRARLTDRSLPVFKLYHNGVEVDTYEFSLARTTKYSATGIKYLSTGIRLDLPENTGSSEYELRAVSDHLFMARPVFITR